MRERREDIPLLVDHLVAKFNRLQGKNIAGVSQEVLVRLMDHDYPGNVRELENIIEQAFVLVPRRIDRAAALARRTPSAGYNIDGPTWRDDQPALGANST